MKVQKINNRIQETEHGYALWERLTVISKKMFYRSMSSLTFLASPHW